MKRALWLGLGAAVGAVAAAIVLVLAYFTIASPVRRLETASGLDLPSNVRLAWERDQRDQFLGQGFTLRAFNAPSEAARAWVADCPRRFSSMRLDQSGIWTKLQEQGLEGGSPACVKKSESATHQEVVVIASERIFHMSLDR
ncbi:MAG: hypothetical protein ACREJ4_16530 [Candidatus Methylomirabilaceae bacterium]